MPIFFNLIGVGIIGGSLLIVALLQTIGVVPQGTAIYFTTGLMLLFDGAYRLNKLKREVAAHAEGAAEAPSKILTWIAPRSGGHLMFIPAWSIAVIILAMHFFGDGAPEH